MLTAYRTIPLKMLLQPKRKKTVNCGIYLVTAFIITVSLNDIPLNKFRITYDYMYWFY